MTLKEPLKAKLSCLIRKSQVVWTPEEEVRQALLGHLIHELSFPASLIAVEKPIRKWAGSQVPDRRIDILCFTKDQKNALCPLLLIECKQYSPNKDHLLQLLGYNFYIKAPYVAVAGPENVLFQTKNELQKSYPFIPRYADLCSAMGL